MSSQPGAGVEPGDLKGAAVFLASTAPDCAQGTILVVDDGWMGQ